MRLPSRTLLIAGLVFLGAGLTLGQAPPPRKPAIKPKPGLVDRDVPTVTRAEEPVRKPVSTATAPQPVGFESDLYCFGYVGDLSEAFPVRVTGAENVAEQTDFIFYDLLYVNGGVDRGLTSGDQFWMVTPEQEIIHPVTRQSMGRLYQYRGLAVVETVEARTASVRVTNTCTDIPMGSYLKRFEPIPIPLARKTAPAVAGDPPSGKPTGRVVFSRDGVVALGADQDVIVDLGAAEGLQAGDFLTIYRYGQEKEFGIRPVGTYWVKSPPPSGVSIPRTYLGEASVLRVGDRWAIARLTDSYRLIEVGDEVELK